MDWLLPAVLVVVLDQASKSAVMARIAHGVSHRSGRGPRIRPIRNISHGLGIVRSRVALVAMWIVALTGTVLLMYYYPPLRVTAAHAGLGVALGGATGNLIDVVWRGAIIDFIDLRVWPVFNVADAAIVTGLLIAFCSVW